MMLILPRVFGTALAVTILATACSSKEEKAAKKREAELQQEYKNAEKAFSDAKYPAPQPVDYGDKSDADTIVREATSNELQVLNLGPMPADEPNPAINPNLPPPAPAADAQLPVAGPQNYFMTCGSYRRTNQHLFDARCVGREVSGVGRVVYSYPSIGTEIIVGKNRYRVHFKALAPSRLFRDDVVTLYGVVGTVPQGESFDQLDDVTIAPVKLKATPAQLRAMKLKQFHEICLDLTKETSGSDVEQKIGEFSLQSGAIHPALANSGSVQLEKQYDRTYRRCIIENNKIKVSQVGHKTYVDGKEVVVWEDRAGALARDEAWSKQHDAEEQAEKKQKADAYNRLSPKEKMGKMVSVTEYAAEAIAEAVPTDISAQGYLEICRNVMAEGLRSWKTEGLVGAYENAARECGDYASKICNPDRHTHACKTYWDKAQPIRSVMLDAR